VPGVCRRGLYDLPDRCRRGVYGESEIAMCAVHSGYIAAHWPRLLAEVSEPCRKVLPRDWCGQCGPRRRLPRGHLPTLDVVTLEPLHPCLCHASPVNCSLRTAENAPPCRCHLHLIGPLGRAARGVAAAGGAASQRDRSLPTPAECRVDLVAAVADGAQAPSARTITSQFAPRQAARDPHRHLCGGQGLSAGA
jgi:hypothetical protein